MPRAHPSVTVGGARAWFTTRGAVGASGHSRTTDEGAHPGDFAALNLGGHVGDDQALVDANRAQVAAMVGAPVWYADQVHGTTVLHRDRPAGVRVRAGEGDAIVLDARAAKEPLAAAMMVADCSPLVLATADGLLGAVVHAGRAGLLDGVVQEAVAALIALDPLCARPGHLHAALGPGICGACYEVSEEIHEQVARALPVAATTTRRGTPGVDVGAGVVEVLTRSCPSVTVDLSALRCTYEAADLFSFRRATHEVAAARARGAAVGYEGPARTGRFAGVLRVGPSPL